MSGVTVPATCSSGISLPRPRTAGGSLGWSAAAHKRAKLVLDALQMALWRRHWDGRRAGPGLVHYSDAGSQYTSFAFTAHLLGAGIDASIATAGDAYDNALMESTIGPYKTELIKPCGPRRSLADRAGHR
jgi:putative transposase